MSVRRRRTGSDAQDVRTTRSLLSLPNPASDIVLGRGENARHPEAEALAAPAGLGSAEAAELYERYGHAAYAVATRIVGDVREAEAVVEDAFAALGGSGAGLRAPMQGARGGTGVLTLVHRKAAERLRAVKQAPRAAAARGGDANGSTRDRAEPRRDRAEHALEQVDGTEGEMLRLAYFEGLTVADLAARYDEPPAAVHAGLRVALEGLRKAFAEHDAASAALSS